MGKGYSREPAAGPVASRVGASPHALIQDNTDREKFSEPLLPPRYCSRRGRTSTFRARLYRPNEAGQPTKTQDGWGDNAGEARIMSASVVGETSSARWQATA